MLMNKDIKENKDGKEVLVKSGKRGLNKGKDGGTARSCC